MWKAYFKWKLLNDAAPYLAKAYVDERFAFQDTVLRGIPREPAPLEARRRVRRRIDRRRRWASSTSPGYFPPENKARMEALVGNLLVAYRQSIDELDWMSQETKTQAQAKLAKFTPKIGYPKRVARLHESRRRQGRPRRQLDAGAGVRVPAQHRQARQADRPQRMEHEAADGQRLLQPGKERDRLSRRRSCSRRSSTWPPTMRSTTAASAP